MLLARFDEPLALAADERVDLLGGKGDGLMRMAGELALPVPPGFVLTTRACRLYLERGWTEELDAALREGMAALETTTGRRFGHAGERRDPGDASGDVPRGRDSNGAGSSGAESSDGGPMPLLVSVRSGAPVSMPGMLDTLLNVGLDAHAMAALRRIDPAFVEACHARLADAFATSLGGAPPERAVDQLRLAVEAVFRSVHSPRAAAYRRREGLSDWLLTAVNVQAMVFGNLDARSATGVYFTRDPATGEPRPYGDVLFRAQGEDVVSGRHATQPLAALEHALPDVARSLYAIGAQLERAYRDLVEIEFTVERGRLWLLQVRVGKRSPRAAVRIAAELALDPEFPLDRREAVLRVRELLAAPPTQSMRGGSGPGARDRGPVAATPDTAPHLPPATPPLARGLGASPGIASGEIATTIEAALECASAGRPVILVRPETSPQDVEGMAVATGLLTSRGGLASHAAVVARGWGIPAVVGLESLGIEADAITLGGRRLEVGEPISIDGDTGEVRAGVIAAGERVVSEAEQLLEWARELGIAIVADATRPRSPSPPAERPPEALEARSDARRSTSSAGAASTSAASSPRDDAARQPEPEPPEEAILRALVIKGSATTEGIAAALASEPDLLVAPVAALVAAGQLVAAKPIGHRLTDDARRRAEALLEADRHALGAQCARDALLAFQPLDTRMKESVTDWQLRLEDGDRVPNDHADAGWDAAVLTRLTSLVDDAERWLAGPAASLPRLYRYSLRLRRALDAVRAGDSRFVASPRVDSLHGIWFELHEDLIRLAGSSRTEELAAGRAG